MTNHQRELPAPQPRPTARTPAARLVEALESVERHRVELGATAETAATTADRERAGEAQHASADLRTARARARGRLSTAEDRTRETVQDIFRGGSPYASARWDSPAWSAEYREPISPPELVAVADLHLREPDGHATFPLALPAVGASVVVSHATGQAAAAQAFAQAYVVRVLAAAPPGAVRVHLLDPAGFGQSLGLLGRLPGPLVTGGVRAVPDDVTAELRAALDHVQRVNAELLVGTADSLPQRWRKGTANGVPCTLVVAGGVPLGLRADDLALLGAVARAGQRCGAGVVAVLDSDRASAHEASLADLRAQAHHFHIGADGYATWESAPAELRPYLKVGSAQPPGTAQLRFLADVVANAARAGLHRPLRLRYLLQQEQRWTATGEDGLSAVMGRGGDGSVQRVVMGDADGIPGHGLVVGPTGAGKTTLLHTLVHSLAYRYAPGELELHLLDLGAGAELAEYAPRPGRPALPHVRTVGSPADPYFALGVLQHLVQLVEHRHELFREAAEHDGAPVTGPRRYREVTGRVLPRVLLVVDELTALVAGETAGQVAQALELLTGQGATHGVHLLLAAQSLAPVGRSATLSAVLDRLRLRVVLGPFDEEPARSPGPQPAASLDGRRPGAGVLNAEAGRDGHDVAFQGAILEPAERARLRAHLAARVAPRPVRVSRGAGGVELADVAGTVRAARQPTLYLGAPVGTSPVALGVPLTPAEGRGLLLSSPDEPAAVAQVSAALAACALQRHEMGLVVVDLLPENLPARRPLDDVLAFLGGDVLHIGEDRFADLPLLLDATASTHVVAVLGLQHAGVAAPLRPDPVHPAAALEWLFTTAPARGVHPLVWIDEPGRMRPLGRESNRLRLRCVGGVDAYTTAAFLGSRPPYAAPRGRLWFRDLDGDAAPALVDPLARPSPEVLATATPQRELERATS